MSCDPLSSIRVDFVKVKQNPLHISSKLQDLQICKNKNKKQTKKSINK